MDSIQGIEQIKSADVVDNSAKSSETFKNTKIVEEPTKLDDVAKVVPMVSTIVESPEIVQEEITEIVGVKASEDARYRKYFKMMQFGVPITAVKLKVSAEGFDSTVLEYDTLSFYINLLSIIMLFFHSYPEKILPDGIPHQVAEEI